MCVCVCVCIKDPHAEGATSQSNRPAPEGASVGHHTIFARCVCVWYVCVCVCVFACLCSIRHTNAIACSDFGVSSGLISHNWEASKWCQKRPISSVKRDLMPVKDIGKPENGIS